MKNTTLVLAVALFFLAPSVHADTIYSNLGPGSTYIGPGGAGNQVCVCGSGFTGGIPSLIADAFTVPVGLGSISLSSMLA